MWTISYSTNSSVIYNHKYTVFMQSTPNSCQILVKLETINRFSKNTQIFDFMKINSVETEVFSAHRRTDRETESTNRIVSLRSFADSSRNLRQSRHIKYLIGTHINRLHTHVLILALCTKYRKTDQSKKHQQIFRQRQLFHYYFLNLMDTHLSWRQQLQEH
jgi:hypothetical protein